MDTLILFIDDDAEDREFFGIAVAQIDPSIHCMFASNGEEALDTLQGMIARLPDFIFLDLNMPRMNGWECLKILKSDERLMKIPVIILTTSKEQRDKEGVMGLGAAHFLTKAIGIANLCNDIRFVLSKEWEAVAEKN